MIRIWILLGLLDLALTITALIMCVTTPEDEIAVAPKRAWIVIIAAMPILGAVLWFSLARKPRSVPDLPASGSSDARGPQRPVGPDDDPEFLRRLGEPPAVDPSTD